MLGPYQLRELRRQLTSLILLLTFLWATIYVTSDLDLLNIYQQITSQARPENQASPHNGPSKSASVPRDTVDLSATSIEQTPNYGVFFGNRISYLSGVNSDNAEMRYFIAGHTEKVRAYCSRSTVYSSAGNFSLIEDFAEMKPDNSGCFVVTKWKRHRDNTVNPPGAPFKFLKGALRELCPIRYDGIYAICSESQP